MYSTVSVLSLYSVFRGNNGLPLNDKYLSVVSPLNAPSLTSLIRYTNELNYEPKCI